MTSPVNAVPVILLLGGLRGDPDDAVLMGSGQLMSHVLWFCHEWKLNMDRLLKTSGLQQMQRVVASLVVKCSFMRDEMICDSFNTKKTNLWFHQNQ